MIGLEKLKQMTAEEAANVLQYGCPYPDFCGFCSDGAGSEKCQFCWLEWLKSDIEDSKAAEQARIAELI